MSKSPRRVTEIPTAGPFTTAINGLGKSIKWLTKFLERGRSRICQDDTLTFDEEDQSFAKLETSYIVYACVMLFSFYSAMMLQHAPG